MNAEEAHKKAMHELKKCVAVCGRTKDWDPELAHDNADDALIMMLSALGYQDIVDEYLKVTRWFS